MGRGAQHVTWGLTPAVHPGCHEDSKLHRRQPQLCLPQSSQDALQHIFQSKPTKPFHALIEFPHSPSINPAHILARPHPHAGTISIAGVTTSTRPTDHPV